MKNEIRISEWILRVGVFGTFLGHGYIALGVKESWIPLITIFGFSRDVAITLMPMIGLFDISIALMILIKPLRIILIWAIFWAFVTALSRPLSGEPIWEFIERTGNWATPLALLLLQVSWKPVKNIFSVKSA